MVRLFRKSYHFSAYQLFPSPYQLFPSLYQLFPLQGMPIPRTRTSIRDQSEGTIRGPGDFTLIDCETETWSLFHGFPVALIVDNGFPNIYHPSESRLGLCASGHMLLVTPWSYQYRHNNQEITVAECKTMNCIAQALCHTKDNWWK